MKLRQTKTEEYKMKTEIMKIISMKHLFNIASNHKDIVTLTYKKPSLMIFNNLHVQWLQSIWVKAEKHFPVYLNKQLHEIEETTTLPVGLIDFENKYLNENTVIQHNINYFAPEKVTYLNFKLIVPEEDAIDYFLQWQRYRKYWWSSVTTTPGIFSIQDVTDDNETSDPTNANIIMNLPWKQQVVESLSITTNIHDMPSRGVLQCSFNLETGLMALLSDAMITYKKEEYLRLHRKIAPYKLSFAIDTDDEETHKSLQDLVSLLRSRLAANNISTWLPALNNPLEQQLREGRRVGAPYAAVLRPRALADGIFHLTSSSTLLSEQTHIAVFDEYAKLLCGK